LLTGFSSSSIGSSNNNNNLPSFAHLPFFSCATGENWQEIMLDCTAGRECESAGDTCGSTFTYPYFITFYFLCSFLMLNLFVAVIMDNFDYLTRDSSILGPHHLDEFVRVWAEYDPEAKGLIHHKEMYEMLRNMEPPVGFGKNCPCRLAYRKLVRMNMPVDESGCVHFTTTLFALIRESLGIKTGPTEFMDQRDNELRETICKMWPVRGRKMLHILIPPDSGKSEFISELVYHKMTVGKIYASFLIIENWRTTRAFQGKGGTAKSASILARFFGAVKKNVHKSTPGSDGEEEIHGCIGDTRVSPGRSVEQSGRESELSCGLRRYPNGYIRFPAVTASKIQESNQDPSDSDESVAEQMTSVSSKKYTDSQWYGTNRSRDLSQGMQDQYSGMDNRMTAMQNKDSEDSEEDGEDDEEHIWHHSDPSEAERRRSLFALSARLTEASGDTAGSFPSDESYQYQLHGERDPKYEDSEGHLVQESRNKSVPREDRLYSPERDICSCPESRYWEPHRAHNYEFGMRPLSDSVYTHDGLITVQPRPYFSPQLDPRVYQFCKGISSSGDDHDHLVTRISEQGHSYHSCVPSTSRTMIPEDAPITSAMLRARKRRWPFRQSSDPVPTERNVDSSFSFGLDYGESYTRRLPPIEEAPSMIHSGRPMFYSVPPPSEPNRTDLCNSYENIRCPQLQPIQPRLPPASTGYGATLFQPVPPPTGDERANLFSSGDNHVTSDSVARLAYPSTSLTRDCLFHPVYGAGRITSPRIGIEPYSGTSYRVRSTIHVISDTNQSIPANLQPNWPTLADSPTHTEYEPDTLMPGRTYEQ
ncbi:Voltage-dependent calcium channel type A subunit alpha-1, partial [Fasciola gigantica]